VSSLAAPLLHVVDDLLPEVVHDTTQYAIPSSGTTDDSTPGDGRCACQPIGPHRRSSEGTPSCRDLRRGHYEPGVEARHDHRLVTAEFNELDAAI
jgi:hypothetical protein